MKHLRHWGADKGPNPAVVTDVQSRGSQVSCRPSRLKGLESTVAQEYQLADWLDTPAGSLLDLPAHLELGVGSRCEFSPGMGDPSSLPWYVCNAPSTDLAGFSTTFSLVGTTQGDVFREGVGRWSATVGQSMVSSVSPGSTVEVTAAWYVDAP